MGKIVISNFEEFKAFEGKELGVSDYLKISQEQINLFADATLDHQWIHTDPERAAKESPFKKTIAHGYLNVSILPFLWEQIADFDNVKLMVNYGIDKLKFSQPVAVDNEVRLAAKLHSIVNLRGVVKAEIDVTLEIKDERKPALTGRLIFLYHFN
ncbi:MaoC family dehydratase [Halosquirtibacter xylanolyticus]|uniref:MaoC family dehydratase n=1 Tax=Halosquirtibacter xylanolyticus TaxID=3374599 RepID=UPI00374A326F|nr:MaoC family dehydratase [Prolixibacteraceae bacterium]